MRYLWASRRGRWVRSGQVIGDWLSGRWAWLFGQGRDTIGRRTKMETTASVWNLEWDSERVTHCVLMSSQASSASTSAFDCMALSSSNMKVCHWSYRKWSGSKPSVQNISWLWKDSIWKEGWQRKGKKKERRGVEWLPVAILTLRGMRKRTESRKGRRGLHQSDDQSLWDLHVNLRGGTVTHCYINIYMEAKHNVKGVCTYCNHLSGYNVHI